MKFVLGLLLFGTIAGSVLADDIDPRIAPSHYFTGYLGDSVTIFGSEDVRIGGGFGYAFGKPEKRFQIGKIPAQIVYEGYVDYTQSNGGASSSSNWTVAFGALAYARWRWPVDRFGNGFYSDLGWGLQYADRATLDLESQFNSTPIVDVGAVYLNGGHEYLLGLRYLHISNAGLKPPNYGQNELYLMLGIRY